MSLSYTKKSAKFAESIHLGTITFSTTWSGSDPYSQVVTVTGANVTSNSKVDLQPDALQITQLSSDGVNTLMIENDDGVLTAWALGAVNTSSMTIQCTVTELG